MFHHNASMNLGAGLAPSQWIAIVREEAGKPDPKIVPPAQARQDLQDREMKMPRMRRRPRAGPSRLRSTLEAPAKGGATDQMVAPAHPRD
jgi:hypothetical protein